MIKNSDKFSPVERSSIIVVLDEFQNNLNVHLHAIESEKQHRETVIVDELFSDTGFWEESDMNLLSSEAREEIEKIQQGASYEKLLDDCSYILNVIETLKQEICQNGTFNSLLNEVKRIADAAEEEENLSAECEELEKTVMELKKTNDKEKLEREEERKLLTEKLNETRNERVKSERLLKMQEKYDIAWEKSQREQEDLRLQMELEKLGNDLNDCKIETQCEQRISRELTNFLTQHIMSIEGKCLEWEDRCEKEKNRYEIEIHTVKSEIESRQQILAQMREEYNERQAFIDNYLAEKEALRLENERQQLILQSAIRIQAWWRGVMVRRKLGPYKPDEKKKKKQGKTKK